MNQYINMTFQRQILCWIYLVFSVCGAIFPMLANIHFMMDHGPLFDIPLFVQMANINPAAQSLSRDLFIGAGSIMTWIIVESLRLRIKYLWIVILLTFTIAFACSAPLFLFLRERRLIELEREGVQVALSQ